MRTCGACANEEKYRANARRMLLCALVGHLYGIQGRCTICGKEQPA